MRLAFIHGINNENNTPEAIAEDWWTWLTEGWTSAGLSIPDKQDISVGYYADLLADAVAGRKPGAVAQGGNSTSRSDALEFLRAYQDAAGVSDEDLEAELAAMGKAAEVVEQGRITEFFVDVAEALERILPRRGKKLADIFLPQAGHYIEDRGVAELIDRTVANSIYGDQEDPVIVVSHSLGTVVAHRITTDTAQKMRNIPLFVTLGSPLGIGMMKRVIRQLPEFPRPPIAEWINGLREDDFVTLGRELETSNLGFSGIINISRDLVEEDDKHAVSAYLRSRPICASIHAALTDG